MNSKLKAALLLAGMFAVGFAAGSCWQACGEPPHRWGWLRHTMREHRMDKLKKELRLSPEQDSSIRDIFSKAHERIQHSREGLDGQIAVIHRDSMNSIRRILHPDQMTQFDQFHTRMHQRRHSPIEAPPPPPASPDDSHPTPGSGR